ncbi:hypothetical protein [Chryseobacterium sp. MYb328]|uniref:hypothetical protein n=1 Tax=Chryseobacterium sp. MYb328 TaxID=2745231 RepID=UPI00309AB426
MKTTLLIAALLISACNCKESKSINKSNPQTGICACEKINNNETIVYATNIHIKKDAENSLLEFRCASILIGTASVSDISGNNEHCEAMYSIQCVSSVNKELQLSTNFKYFTDKLQSKDMFFEDLKNNEDDYFEFRLAPDRKIISISRLNIH